MRFAYEWHDDSGRWFRSYGNENWEFAPNGLMKQRIASINDIGIEASQRLLLWFGIVRPAERPGARYQPSIRPLLRPTRLNFVSGQLPRGVTPALGPDATGVGWIYEYALVDRSGRHDLAELRSLQDWFLRYQLQTRGPSVFVGYGLPEGLVTSDVISPRSDRFFGLPVSVRLARHGAEDNKMLA